MSAIVNSQPVSTLPTTHRNPASTLYIGNLPSEITEKTLTELFTQVARVQSVYIPKDKIYGNNQGYGFVELKTEVEANYAMKILNLVKLGGKPVRLNKSQLAEGGKVAGSGGIGANLFIGNLDESVDSKLLNDVFSSFGEFAQMPNVAVGEDGVSKGFGFVSYMSFESSDLAIEVMNDEFVCNRQVSVQYAYRKDEDGGRERHGSRGERMMAASILNITPGSKEASAIVAAYQAKVQQQQIMQHAQQQQQYQQLQQQANASASVPVQQQYFAQPPQQNQGYNQMGSAPPPPPPPPPQFNQNYNSGNNGSYNNYNSGGVPPPPPPPPPRHMQQQQQYGQYNNNYGGNMPPPPPPPQWQGGGYGGGYNQGQGQGQYSQGQDQGQGGQEWGGPPQNVQPPPPPPPRPPQWSGGGHQGYQ